MCNEDEESNLVPVLLNTGNIGSLHKEVYSSNIFCSQLCICLLICVGIQVSFYVLDFPIVG